MTDELSNTNQLKADEMTVDTDASHTTPRHLTARGARVALARSLGVSNAVVSDTLSGKRWPPVTVLLGIVVWLTDNPPRPHQPEPAPARTRSGFPIVR